MKDARGDLIDFSRMALTLRHIFKHSPRRSNLGSSRLAVKRGYDGIVNCSPRDSKAQAMRAFFAAMATIARQ